MRPKANDEALIVRYFLGDLSAEERGEIQGRFFADDDYFRRMLAVENELIDSYARGELSSAERERFEKNFIDSPARRQRVEFARALAEVVAVSPARGEAETPVPRASRWLPLPFFTHAHNRTARLALAAVAVAIAVGGAFLLREVLRPRPQNDRLQAERQQPPGQVSESPGLNPSPAEPQPKSDETVAQRQQEQAGRGQTHGKAGQPQPTQQKTGRGRAAQPPVLSFILSPRVVRDADETQSLVIPRRARWIRLQLDLHGADDYKNYRATLTATGGDEVWRQGGLLIRQTGWGSAVVLRLPAEVLTTGRYELTLTGFPASGEPEEVGYYYFSVVKK